jgi:hypothetical protein
MCSHGKTNKCKICGSLSNFIFRSKVLNKYEVSYYQCSSCKFIQMDEPFWLDEAYSSAIGVLDIGLLYRNIELSHSVENILDQFTNKEDSYLDYGGGYGVFVRLMRDKGFDFYLYDKYCENLFAKFLELKDYKKGQFAALSAFEVFEHLPNPIEEISKMWSYSDTIIFSTELQPNVCFSSDKDWWYFVPLGGQHVSFYHEETLNALSKIFNCKLFTNRVNLHVLTKKDIENPFIRKSPNTIAKALQKLKIVPNKKKITNRSSLLMSDWDYYLKKIGIQH